MKTKSYAEEFDHLIQDNTYYISGQIPVKLCYIDDRIPSTAQALVQLHNLRDSSHPLLEKIANKYDRRYTIGRYAV